MAKCRPRWLPRMGISQLPSCYRTGSSCSLICREPTTNRALLVPTSRSVSTPVPAGPQVPTPNNKTQIFSLKLLDVLLSIRETTGQNKDASSLQFVLYTFTDKPPQIPSSGIQSFSWDLSLYLWSLLTTLSPPHSFLFLIICIFN